MFQDIAHFTHLPTDWSEQLVPATIAIVIALSAAVIVHATAFRLLERFARRTGSEAESIVIRHLKRPSRWALIALGLVLAAREIPALDDIWQKLAGFIMPALIGWMALAILLALLETMALKADISTEDNLKARQQRTRLAIFRSIGGFIIVFVTVGLMLLSIPGVRDIGVTLMASAGLAGLAVGAAAQPALKSMIGGVQLALTEPISLDDVVIIGGEWGRIEEIRMTYIVVKVWDKRRLIVPTTKFLEEIFQNWTKTSADLIGTVFLYLDPATDIAPLREEYTRQITGNRLWDKQAQSLQVTDATGEVIEVRLLMSARDSGTLFDLRCEIREAMIDWIRRAMPEAIVRRRVLSPEPFIFGRSDDKGGSGGARSAPA